eukprot:Em0012g444a
MTIWILFSALLGGSCYFAGATPRPTTGSLDFLVVGDWGGQDRHPFYTTAQKNVARAMGVTAANIASKFTIGLGDNFYSNGVTDVADPRFRETFENVFKVSSLQSRWYMVCGNHDHRGNVSAQVEYTKLSTRWYMPSLYYTRVGGTTSTVQFIFIDTSILHDHVFGASPASKQWAWITKTLQQSTADWIIMAGHHPVWSVAWHGPTTSLVEKLKPLLMKYGVSVYFAGHEHNLQHIKEDNSDVNYFVSGAGHLISHSNEHALDVPIDSLKYQYAPDDPLHTLGGYASVSMTPNNMRVTFYDASAIKLYSVMLQPIARKKHQT